MGKKKEYIDDGHTIADMSGVERPGMFGHFPAGRKHMNSESGRDSASPQQEEGTQPPFTRKERRMYTLAAVKAGLLIGLVYIIGIGALIGLMYLAWHH